MNTLASEPCEPPLDAPSAALVDDFARFLVSQIRLNRTFTARPTRTVPHRWVVTLPEGWVVTFSFLPQDRPSGGRGMVPHALVKALWHLMRDTGHARHIHTVPDVQVYPIRKEPKVAGTADGHREESHHGGT